MNSKFKDILFVFPVMGYFALEALIVGLVIAVVWKLFLSQVIGNLGYPQIAAIYWIAKMLQFDVFKLIAGFQSLGRRMEEENNNEFVNYDNDIEE
jgi:hypothetical protein